MLSYVRSFLLRSVFLVAVALPLMIVILRLSAMMQPSLLALAHSVTVRFASVSSASPVSRAASVPIASSVGMSVLGGPSISADIVNTVLARAGSPAQGTGQALYDYSLQYHIDDAYALAVFQHESTYGLYGAGSVNHALGNIICAGFPTCNGRFRWYATWADGYADFYRLIAEEYVAHGLVTVQAITPVYAPSSENDPVAYIESVVSSMQAYRALASHM